MFKYISSILAQFSTPQKIVALSILLLSIVIITIAPSLISSITLDREELNSEIKRQDTKIEKLKNDVDSLEHTIRKNGMECTNSIVSREEEFLIMLDKLREDLKNKNMEKTILRVNTTTQEKKIYPVGDSLLQMTFIPEEPKKEQVIIYKKPSVNSTLSMIEDMKKKIKRN